MSIEKNIGLLAEATTGLLEAVNVRESTLDAKVQDAEASALQAASKVPLAEAEKAATESAALQAETYKDATLTSLNTVKNDINYLELEAIAQTKSVSAVDVFVYDTSKDSDGGAWRKRTRKTSWYKEELNTATRGSRREFPSVAVIVAHSAGVTIYDGDDPSLPMWMVFSWGVRNFIGSFFGSTGVTSLSIKNGLLCIGQNGDGVSSIDFLKETAFKVSTPYVVNWNRTIDRRNENSSTNTNTYDKTIVNRRINDVAMTVLPDAPIDPATGLPVPTIAVATEGGVSVIKDDGTVYYFNQNTAINNVCFLDDNKILILQESYGGYAFIYPSPQDINQDGVNYLKYLHWSNPFNYPIIVGQFFSGTLIKDVIGSPYGMTKLSGNPYDMGCDITTDYNTGWMNGDIKMAALSDTDATELVAEGDELVTNGTFDTDISGWELLGTNATNTVEWENGAVRIVSDGSSANGLRQIGLTVGKKYILTFDLTVITGGVKPWDGAQYVPFTSSGTHSLIVDYDTAGIAIYRNSGVTDVLIDNVSVKEVQGIPAQQPVSTQRPTYNATTKSLELDLVDDSLVYNVPTGGIDGYMVIGTDQGTASYGVSLPEGPYEIGGDYFPGNEIHGFLLREGDSSTNELATVENYFVEQGAKASYGDVTNFDFYWRDKGITEFPLIDTSSGTRFQDAWRNNNLTSFPLLDTSSVANFSSAWRDNSLTSFPLIDTSSGTNFGLTWYANNLTSFPLIDTSSGTNFYATWNGNNLTSFPLIDTSNGTNFQSAWSGNNLTSFPLIDTGSGTNFSGTWRANTSLSDFPANMFDNCLATNFTYAFTGTNLSQASIDGILVSIESNGTSNGTFGQSGGSAPSATGEAAINALVTRGWTVSVTGGYQGKVLPEGLFENDENGFWYSMDIGE